MWLAEYRGVPGHYAADLCRCPPPLSWLRHPGPVVTLDTTLAMRFASEAEAQAYRCFGAEWVPVACDDGGRIAAGAQ